MVETSIDGRRHVASFATEDAAWQRIDEIRVRRPDMMLSVRFGGNRIRRPDRLYDGSLASR